MNYLEPYVKEKNLLQLGLFYFGRGEAPKRIETNWKDENGKSYKLICDCSYGVPSSFDFDVYTSCMRIWVKQGMSSMGIVTNYSEIARELGVNPQSYNLRIKKSLLKLGKARYELRSCFISVQDEKTKEDGHTIFSLFDTADLFEYQKGDSKKKSKFTLVFTKKIKDNLEAKYYQYLDMAWYKRLPEGLSRRLYEYLAKRKYHKDSENTFKIAEVALCRWLPINDKHTTNRRKRIENITQPLIDHGFLSNYFLDKRKRQCVFVYNVDASPYQENHDTKVFADEEQKNIPGNQNTEKIVVQLENSAKPEENQSKQQLFIAVLDWINTIPYFHKKKRTEIAGLPMEAVISLYPNIRKEYEQLTQLGETPRSSWVYDRFVKCIDQAPGKVVPQTKHAQGNFLNDSQADKSKIDVENLIALIDQTRLSKIPQKLHREIEKYLSEEGYEYVKNSILYANQRAKKKYSSYLQRTLVENWAEEWIEEHSEKLKFQEEQEKLKIEEERKRIEAEKKENLLEEQRIEFKEKVKKIPKMVKDMLMEKAEEEIKEDEIARAIKVKNTYCELLLKLLNEQGINFDKEIFNPVLFINEVAIL